MAGGRHAPPPTRGTSDNRAYTDRGSFIKKAKGDKVREKSTIFHQALLVAAISSGARPLWYGLIGQSRQNVISETQTFYEESLRWYD